MFGFVGTLLPSMALTALEVGAQFGAHLHQHASPEEHASHTMCTKTLQRLANRNQSQFVSARRKKAVAN
jgi:hypothetical protein